MPIRVRRIYSDREPADGARVLVDRLWPRGVSKERAGLDLWARDIAPSSELRAWVKRGGGDWDTFRARYAEELGEADEEIAPLLDLIRDRRTLTLLYASRDVARNHARVLADHLSSLTGEPVEPSPSG